MIERKKVLIVSCVFPPEPVVSARLSLELAGELTKLGYQVGVIHPPASRPNGYSFFNSRDCYQFKTIQTNSFISPQSRLFTRMYESWSFGKAVAKNLKIGIADVIYINTWPLLSQFLIMRKAKKLNIPVVTHIQDVYPESLYNKLPKIARSGLGFLKYFDEYVIRHSAAVICISDEMLNFYRRNRKNFNSKSFKTILNWLPLTHKIESVITKENQAFRAFFSAKKNIVYLGNIGPVAGLDTIIPLFKNNPDVSLIIAGDGSAKEDLIELTKRMQIKNVVFSSVSGEDTNSFLSKADICLLTMRQGEEVTSVPSKLISYVLNKKPVLLLASQNGQVAKFVKEADCGWIIDYNDQKAISTFINDIIYIAPEVLIEKGANGKKYAINILDPAKNITDLIKIIRTVASEGSQKEKSEYN